MFLSFLLLNDTKMTIIGCGNVLLDERRLSSGVLSHDQHHWLVVKVCILQAERVEVMETVKLLQGQQLLSIQGLEPFCHGADHLRRLLHVFSPPA